jgi:hypothetical protein
MSLNSINLFFLRFILIVLVLMFQAKPSQAQPYDGIILYNSLYSRTAQLIDNSGQLINSWSCSNTPAYAPYLMPDSTIWRPGVYPGASMRGGVYGGLIQQFNWEGNIIRSFIWSDSNHQQHHDIHPMPNGNVLVLAWERKTRDEALAMGRVNITGEMWPEEIIEYAPVGDSVVWEWHIWDHLIQDVDSTKPNFGVVREHPELVDINLGTLFLYGDWVHANIVDYNVERDEIVFSSHFLNELYVIDHSTTTEEARGHSGGRHGKGGDILYRWGNPQNYGRGDSTDQRFFVVHCANWIRPGLLGAGNILVFNNGDRPGTANDYSSLEEITPPLDSNDHYCLHPDSAYGPTEPSWIYSNPGVFYSGHMSGAYRLPNNNTFICEAVSGRLSEVTYDGQIVWIYQVQAWTGRAIKYPRDFATSIEESALTRVKGTRLRGSSLARAGQIVLVQYELDALCRVQLRVFDAVGRQKAVLVNQTQVPGQYELRFVLPVGNDGILFIQLTTHSGTTDCIKLVLTK